MMIYDGTQKYVDNPDAFKQQAQTKLTDLSNDADRNMFAKKQLAKKHGDRIVKLRLVMMAVALLVGIAGMMIFVSTSFSAAKSQDIHDYGTSAYQAQKVVNQLSGDKRQYDRDMRNAKTSKDALDRLGYLKDAQSDAGKYNSDYQDYSEKYSIQKIITNWGDQGVDLPSHLKSPSLW